MIKHLKNNPILLHQMRHARWPSLRTAVWIAAALTVIGLALTITVYTLHPDSDWLAFSSIIVVLIELLLAFGPLITAVLAVGVTVRSTNIKADQVVRLSQLTEHDIANGHIASVVFRLRSLWMVAVGLLLPLVMALTHLNVIATINFACLVASPGPGPCVPPSPSEIFIEQAGVAVIATIFYVILFTLWNGLATTLGVWMAFRIRRTGMALAGTLLRLVLIIGVHIVVFWVILRGAVRIWALLFALLSFAGIDIALGRTAYRQTVNCVRGTLE